MVISIRHVVVNPARTAACVAIAEKFSVYKLSSYNRRMTTTTTTTMTHRDAKEKAQQRKPFPSA
jgi:hypothetical protein